jgi:CheY-like chemotaxis protein
VLQGLLRPLGFSVYAASSGVEGIDLARRCQPDLVLLDIQMRGLSGWEVAAQLRAIDDTRPPGHERLKIVLVSANAHEFAGGNDGAAAHDGFVLKPVALETLLDAIAAQLRLDWTAAAPPAPPALAPPAPFADLGDAAASLAGLRHLGRVGHVRGIEAGLDALAADFPASRPLVDQLRGHLRAFDLKSFLKLLDSHG